MFLDLIKEGSFRLNKKHLDIINEFESRSINKPLSIEEHKNIIKEKIYNLDWQSAEKPTA